MDGSAALFDFDKQKRSIYGIVCGVDEAGRGPLAGAVFAAAVILPADVIIEGLDDSKKLSEKKREHLYSEIIVKAAAYAITQASVDEIEELNILQAAMLAMRRALEALALNIKPDYALIDGNHLPKTAIPCEAVVKGDAISASIAAASVLAKVARDREMLELALEYPQYGFEKHKGYGTKLHCEALREYGMCEVHRKSFLKKLEMKS
ncbi:MAG: ribonuclease HII [Oscillospiraceae bacterium]|nr:ribonuclease HII [Oscillospiraceae bacterium]